VKLMPRPRRFRRVWQKPGVTYFKPAGIRMIDLKDSILTVDEFEAVRLKDLEGMDQEKAAKKMNISQPTFHRLVLSARKKIADAIVNGKAIKIKGGNYMLGRGRMGGKSLGPAGECVCPKCGNRAPHQRAVPCYKQKCTKCGTIMTR